MRWDEYGSQIAEDAPAFPCTQCGACCRRASSVEPGWPVQADGKTCIHLDGENRCGIYETRPFICRISEAQLDSGMGMDDYFRLSAKACNTLQKIDGMPESFRVRI